MARAIEPWARDILTRSSIAGQVLKLPGQLERPDYVRIDKILKGLGGKWDRKAGGHVFPFDPRELVSEAAANGAFTDRRQTLQFFETPQRLADRMAEMLTLAPHEIVLEPSAGLGRLVRPMLERRARVVTVEIDATNHEALCQLANAHPGWMIVHLGDFLDFRRAWLAHRSPAFDAVAMNPPFRNDQDIAHIQAAWSLLKPSGRLVAIASEGPFFRSDRRAAAFREWLAANGIDSERLPENTFSESGTGVRARLLCGHKQQEPLAA